MKIEFSNNPKQIELIKAVGSKNKAVSLEAQEALAAFITPVASKVVSVAGTASRIYNDFTYDEDDSPSIPLDLYHSEGVGYVTVWSQSIAGGLPASQVAGVDELKVATYPLHSAISLLKKYARKSRLDVVAKTFEKMLQEVLLKQERNAWATLLKALAEANTNGLSHVIDATTDDIFQVHDLNKLMTRIARINTAFEGGTPDGEEGDGLTDLFVSPEIVEQVRAFAYQPMNTRNGATTTSGATSVPLPDSVREQIYRAAGTQEIYGVGITQLRELGDGKKYNTLFKNFYAGSFTNASDQILIGVDLSRPSCLRPLAKNADHGETFTVLPDDQYVTRQDKVGWYGALEEGRIVVDSKPLVGMIV